MFGPPGHLYVYFTYGMHFCCNVVCLDEGSAGAVLLRALEPVEGLPVMRARRAATRTGASARERVLPDIDLASGPGKLCQALGIDRRVDGADLLGQDSPVRLAAQESPSSTATPEVCSGPRVGIDHTSDTGLEPWRWWLCSNPHVSRARGGVRTGRRTSGIR
jgi:DNA-3-methyladenine glycosylase